MGEAGFKPFGIHKNVLGRYERNEVSPSIDIARRIANVLEMRLNYLTDKQDVQIDKDTSSRILEVSKFDPEDRNHIFRLLMLLLSKEKYKVFYKTKSQT